MGRRCSICHHSRRYDIEVLYVHTLNYKLTARVFGVGYKSLSRHWDNCIPREGRKIKSDFEIARMVAKVFAAYEEKKRREAQEQWLYNRRFNPVDFRQRYPRPKSIVKHDNLKPIFGRKLWTVNRDKQNRE